MTECDKAQAGEKFPHTGAGGAGRGRRCCCLFFARLRLGRLAIDQAADAVMQILVLEDEEHSTAAILAGVAIGGRRCATLLIEVSKDDVVIASGHGSADLGVIGWGRELDVQARSEERRVGKECRSRWS